MRPFCCCLFCHSSVVNILHVIYSIVKLLWDLTLWEPVYKYIIPRFQPYILYLDFSLILYLDFSWLPYQCHSSSVDCTRELSKPSKDLASLLVCTRKNFFCWGLWIFYEWHHKWSSFWAILVHVSWPRAQPLGQSISLKFLLETRLESESFELLIDFLVFLVQKLWSKMN